MKNEELETKQITWNFLVLKKDINLLISVPINPYNRSQIEYKLISGKKIQFYYYYKSVILAMVFHSHLSLTEVIGMLAGKIIENGN